MTADQLNEKDKEITPLLLKLTRVEPSIVENTNTSNIHYTLPLSTPYQYHLIKYDDAERIQTENHFYGKALLHTSRDFTFLTKGKIIDYKGLKNSFIVSNKSYHNKGCPL